MRAGSASGLLLRLFTQLCEGCVFCVVMQKVLTDKRDAKRSRHTGNADGMHVDMERTHVCACVPCRC
jgi:hypothetical protein